MNRLEIIDHTSQGVGRLFLVERDSEFEVSIDVQDSGKTMKIFINDSTEA